MIRFTTPLYDKLIEELELISADADSLLQKARLSSEVVYATIQKINDFILAYSFRNDEEEILFFKEIKPKFLKELYYYKRIYDIERRIPIGNNEQLKEYYNYELRHNGLYFGQNEQLFSYYRMNETISDTAYFLRRQAGGLHALESEVDIDNRCCTVTSLKLAKLQAYELVHEHLQACIYKLEHPEMLLSGKGSSSPFFWTAGKNDLTEVMIGVVRSGAVNHGKVSLSNFARGLGLFLNIDLGNFHRAVQNMKIRKKNPAPYIDRVKESFIKSMTENL